MPQIDALQSRAMIVLGPFRGGTSVTCGALHHLGVFVGKHFFDAKNKYCTYEALGLRTVCNRCFAEYPTGWNALGSSHERINQLAGWMDFARRQAAVQGCIGVGGKHPTLCKLVDEAAEAFKNASGDPPRFISVIRPIDEVLAGWERAVNTAGNPWWRRPDREHIVRDLVASRDQALQNHDHIRFSFADLRREPRMAIKSLAEQCELPLTHLDRATQFIQR